MTMNELEGVCRHMLQASPAITLSLKPQSQKYLFPKKTADTVKTEALEGKIFFICSYSVSLTANYYQPFRFLFPSSSINEA